MIWGRGIRHACDQGGGDGGGETGMGGGGEEGAQRLQDLIEFEECVFTSIRSRNLFFKSIERLKGGGCGGGGGGGERGDGGDQMLLHIALMWWWLLSLWLMAMRWFLLRGGCGGRRGGGRRGAFWCAFSFVAAAATTAAGGRCGAVAARLLSLASMLHDASQYETVAELIHAIKPTSCFGGDHLQAEKSSERKSWDGPEVDVPPS